MLQIQKKLSNSFLALLSLPATAVGFALSTQIAALSWILKNKFGLEVHDITFVWLAGPLAGIIGQPIVGAISDNAWFLGGRRKGFIMIGGIVGSLMFLALPQIGVISKNSGLELILIASIVALLLDLSINITFNPARSIIADLTPEGKVRVKSYAIMQIVSGIFGVLAYFISMIQGNEFLLYIAAIIVLLFSIIPNFFIEEIKNVNNQEENNQLTNNVKQNNSFIEMLKSSTPLYGFLLFGIFSLIHHFYSDILEPIHNPLIIICLLYTIIFGIFLIIKSKKNSDYNIEFKKIMLAHSFTWVAIQSMFVVTGFYVSKVIIPNIDISSATANFFAEFLTTKQQTAQSTEGNIVSLGFLILNAVGAIFPIFLERFSKTFGRVKTYTFALFFSAIGYFWLAYFGNNEFNFYLGMFLVGIGWSAVISIVFSIMTERVEKLKMGLYMGVFNLAVVLPQMMSNGIGNILKTTENYQLLYLFSGILVTISCIFWLFVREPESTSHNEVPVSSGH